MNKTYQSIVIEAPVDKVWSAIRDFHDFSWAPNVITKCEVVGDLSGDQIGAKRKLNDAFAETLHELNEADHFFKFSIDNGPSPVSKDDVENYFGNVRLHPITDSNKTFVEWSSSWNGKGDQTQEFCHGIYVALLNDMQKSIA